MVRPVSSEHVFRVYGMRRSGNHAIIDWIMRNAPGGNGLFLNNCRHGQDPLATARLPKLYENGAARHVKLNAEHDVLQDMAFVLVSYEDVVPPPRRAPLFNVPETCVIILRSFRNWLASLLKKLQNNPDYTPIDRFRIMTRSISLYRDMAEMRQLSGLTVISYDTWLTSQSYRSALLKTLGLDQRDTETGELQHYGGGSSFAQTDANGPEHPQAKRYLTMEEDWEYQTLMAICSRDETLVRVMDLDLSRVTHAHDMHPL